MQKFENIKTIGKTKETKETKEVKAKTIKTIGKTKTNKKTNFQTHVHFGRHGSDSFFLFFGFLDGFLK